MRAAVFLTSGAGGDAHAEHHAESERVTEAFRLTHIEPTIHVVKGAELGARVRAAVSSEADTIVVGGGDGSISTAAGIMAGGRKPLGVLPLGTLNHFAKDLGIPLTLEDAVQALAQGHVREIDVGEVNGQVFVNNSSIGLYPRAVNARDEHQERHGWSKWPAMVYAALGAVREFRLLRVSLRTDGLTRRVKTPFVFVGNNEYEMSLLAMGKRSCMDAGRLGLYIAKTTGRVGLVRLALHAIIGRLDQSKEFESLCLSEFDIESRRWSLRVARDGEVTRMRPPLRYRTRPRALRVIVPPRSS